MFKPDIHWDSALLVNERTTEGRSFYLSTPGSRLTGNLGLGIHLSGNPVNRDLDFAANSQ